MGYSNPRRCPNCEQSPGANVWARWKDGIHVSAYNCPCGTRFYWANGAAFIEPFWKRRAPPTKHSCPTCGEIAILVERCKRAGKSWQKLVCKADPTHAFSRTDDGPWEPMGTRKPGYPPGTRKTVTSRPPVVRKSPKNRPQPADHAWCDKTTPDKPAPRPSAEPKERIPLPQYIGDKEALERRRRCEDIDEARRLRMTLAEYRREVLGEAA